VYNIDIRNTAPQSIYQKLVKQFHRVLIAIDFDRRKDGMPQNRTITLHSFRRFVKSTISIQANSDYSEWILGHKNSSYWSIKPETRAEIYSTKCMKYLTFLDYSTLKATGKTMEAKINEMEREKQIMSQKYEEQMNAMQLQINRITEMIQYNPKLARLKQTALTRLANKK
jgi:hypothetical protein